MGESSADVRLSRELIYYAGHGFTGRNAHRYPTLLDLAQVHGGLPIGATPPEIAGHVDNVLIATLSRLDRPSFIPKLERELPAGDVRRHLTKLLGLPPYQRAKDLERHRGEVAEELAAGSISTWRRPGGAEEQLFTVLAAQLLQPPGPLSASRWLVRESRLHYFFGTGRSIERLRCEYDGEVLADGVTSFGVDHRSTAAGKAARYEVVEGSVIGAPRTTAKQLTDGALALDLHFAEPLQRGDRRTLGYELHVRAAYEAFQLLRLNASVEVWAHQLTITFTEGFLPPRVWWFAHHVGVGAGEEPAHYDHDLPWDGNTVRQRFSGLRQGPDYGAAWNW